MSTTRSGRSRLELPAHLEPPAAWREIRAEVRRTVGESTFEIWLAPLEMVSLHEDLLLLKAPATKKAWVAKRFGRLLAASARAVLRRDVRVAFESDGGVAGAAPPGAGPPGAAPPSRRSD